jgi:hypothetical protein
LVCTFLLYQACYIPSQSRLSFFHALFQLTFANHPFIKLKRRTVSLNKRQINK